ncbi:MAG TPA: hypothetical protein PLW80_06490 [Spirochaetales bacterium]|nr:hypothetical protein [Spirochaetales bacterium]
MHIRDFSLKTKVLVLTQAGLAIIAAVIAVMYVRDIAKVAQAI